MKDKHIEDSIKSSLALAKGFMKTKKQEKQGCKFYKGVRTCSHGTICSPTKQSECKCDTFMTRKCLCGREVCFNCLLPKPEPFNKEELKDK